MRVWVILVSLSLLVICTGQEALQAQPLDDIKEIKKQFQQYVQEQRPIINSIMRKVIKDREKGLERRWSALGWYKSRDRIKDSAPWNKRYYWQPSDNLPTK